MISLALNVLTLWGLYFLLGLGVVVCYKGTRIINLALPGTMVCSAYLAADLVPKVGPVPALATGLGLSALLGAFTYLVAVWPVLGRPRFVGIMSTLAVGLLFQAVTVLVWRGNITVLSLLPADGLRLGGVAVSAQELAVWLVALAVGVAFGLFYRRSKLGLWLAATADNPLLARLRAVPVSGVVLGSFTVAGSLAFLGALLLSLRTGVTPGLGQSSLIAMAVAMAGGLDSVAGTAVAALIVAALQAAVISMDPKSGTVVPFVVMMLMLLVRPWGLLGTAEEVERV